MPARRRPSRKSTSRSEPSSRSEPPDTTLPGRMGRLRALRPGSCCGANFSGPQFPPIGSRLRTLRVFSRALTPMTARSLSLLLTLGLLLPQASVCMGFDMSEAGCSPQSCCCDDQSSAGESGHAVVIATPDGGDCACVLSQPVSSGKVTLTTSPTTVQFPAVPVEAGQFTTLSTASAVLSSPTRTVVAGRPLRVTHGVRLL